MEIREETKMAADQAQSAAKENYTVKTCSCEAYKKIIAEKDAEIERLKDVLDGVLTFCGPPLIRDEAEFYKYKDVAHKALSGGEE